jgi:hypothetical protein
LSTASEGSSSLPKLIRLSSVFLFTGTSAPRRHRLTPGAAGRRDVDVADAGVVMRAAHHLEVSSPSKA